ncbi:MAG: sulfatase, partial [Candidatus Binatus sp.]
MRIGARGRIAVLAVVVVAAVGWAVFQRYWYYLPGLVASIRNPIEPNHPVTWDNGPAVPAAPADKRPPNAIIILADDLGFNDITV